MSDEMGAECCVCAVWRAGLTCLSHGGGRGAGVWDPEWVAATLVVYEPGHPCPFTIVFEDQGVHVRHGMDFFQLQLPLPLGEGRGGSGADTDED